MSPIAPNRYSGTKQIDPRNQHDERPDAPQGADAEPRRVHRPLSGRDVSGDACASSDRHHFSRVRNRGRGWMVGAMVGASERAEEFVATLEARLTEAQSRAKRLLK